MGLRPFSAYGLGQTFNSLSTWDLPPLDSRDQRLCGCQGKGVKLNMKGHRPRRAHVQAERAGGCLARGEPLLGVAHLCHTSIILMITVPINRKEDEQSTGSLPCTVRGAVDTGGKKTEFHGEHVVGEEKTPHRSMRSPPKGDRGFGATSGRPRGMRVTS